MGKPTNPAAFRAARGTQRKADVLRAAKIGRNTLNRLETKAAVRPAAHVIEALAKVYGKPTDFFYEEPK